MLSKVVIFFLRAQNNNLRDVWEKWERERWASAFSQFQER